MWIWDVWRNNNFVIDMFIYSSIQVSIHSFMFPPSIHLFIHSSIHSFIHPFIRSFIYPSIHPSIHPFIHPFILPLKTSSILMTPFFMHKLYTVHSISQTVCFSFPENSQDMPLWKLRLRGKIWKKSSDSAREHQKVKKFQGNEQYKQTNHFGLFPLLSRNRKSQFKSINSSKA